MRSVLTMMAMVAGAIIAQTSQARSEIIYLTCEGTNSCSRGTYTLTIDTDRRSVTAILVGAYLDASPKNYVVNAISDKFITFGTNFTLDRTFGTMTNSCKNADGPGKYICRRETKKF